MSDKDDIIDHLTYSVSQESVAMMLYAKLTVTEQDEYLEEINREWEDE